MNQLVRSIPLRRFACAALLLYAGLAQAQYVWIDAKGVRQYSDRPPPPGTPRAQILKAPKGLAQEPDAPPAAQAQIDKKKGPPTLAEREQDFRKRQQARAEEDTKAAEETQRKQAQAENCEAARRYKAALESGERMSTTTASGERGFLTDAERTLRLAKTIRVLADCR
ncbi:DUF4124 domain-containing protein [Massilia horti]|uniref:DUF4124 domain-containing protein n=1 Tax=Massilia horti TaxID=2562153 RepID=A0A4Y9T173_9BURK|nr:DUF4124 domain-containing protein [Massilia horti]TFW32953.1 DUF4124 domain-containing protein [Massilia horti]